MPSSPMFSSTFTQPLQYPPARRDESIVDDYFSHLVPDPYRWLEDPESEETNEFVQNQVKLTESVLKGCELRDKIQDKITQLVNFERYCTPFKRGDKYFYFHNTGLQPHNLLYIQDDLEAKAEVLIDPNTLNEGKPVALHLHSVSNDAKYIAYGLSLSGNDWLSVKVLSIEDRRVLPDTLSWIKFTNIGWTHDNKGFFYTRFPPPIEGQSVDTAGSETNCTLDQELRYHFVGTDDSEDILCWKDLQYSGSHFDTQLTDDGKYLLLLIKHGENQRVYYYDLTTLPNELEGLRGEKSELLPFTKLVDDFEASYGFIVNEGTVFTFRTNKDAPRYKLVRVDLKNPSVWTDVVPQSDKHVLESAHAVNKNQLLVRYMSDVKSVLQIRDLESGSLLHTLPLDIGAVDSINGHQDDSEVFFRFNSFLTPGIIYRCDLSSGAPELKIFKENIVRDFDRTEYEVNQVFIPSKDGTVQLPMFIVARKGISLDGSHPCLLTGYGGFNISILPSFSASRLVIMKHLDGVFCSATLRGGGEYGEEWHQAAWLGKKQNAFDDFISAAEFLIAQGYTQPSKLCIEGGSNGGLLVGAVINQRPDLYGCAIANCGVQDMLRFHKFTIGHYWTVEYGCSDNEEDFKWLIKYSPLHTVKRPWEASPDNPSQYPATMLLTADRDNRVVPLHSLKLLATLQYVLFSSLENNPQKNPIIARIECKFGHYGKPTQKQIVEAADRYGFMAKAVNASWID